MSRVSNLLSPLLVNDVWKSGAVSLYRKIMTEQFQGVLDRYNGVTVDLEDEPCTPHEFAECFRRSIDKWNEEKKRCIWFKVPIKDAALVPLLANEGFNFHHSRDSFVMMYKWLPADSSPNLPPASHTNLGVGGLVFKNDKEILVVAEQHIQYPHWKLPGGYVERGEDIVNAAIREVKEETSVDSEFESVVTLRHTHNMSFGNSDVYIVVMLKATSESILKSDDEIRDCRWMDIDEFLQHPHVHEFNRFIVRQALDLKERNIKLNLPKSNVKFATWSRDITSLVIEDL